MEGWRAKAIFVISQKSIYLKQLHFTFCHSLIKRNVTIRLVFLLFSSPSSILQIIYGVMGKQVTSWNTKERKHKRAERKKTKRKCFSISVEKNLGNERLLANSNILCLPTHACKGFLALIFCYTIAFE